MIGCRCRWAGVDAILVQSDQVERHEIVPAANTQGRGDQHADIAGSTDQVASLNTKIDRTDSANGGSADIAADQGNRLRVSAQGEAVADLTAELVAVDRVELAVGQGDGHAKALKCQAAHAEGVGAHLGHGLDAIADRAATVEHHAGHGIPTDSVGVLDVARLRPPVDQHRFADLQWPGQIDPVGTQSAGNIEVDDIEARLVVGLVDRPCQRARARGIGIGDDPSSRARYLRSQRTAIDGDPDPPLVAGMVGSRQATGHVGRTAADNRRTGDRHIPGVELRVGVEVVG